jgi:predicted ferric reductase
MSPAVWYFARSAGLVAYLLLSGSVILGVLMSARARFTWPRFAVEEVHRFLAILTGIFVTLHGASLLLDRVVAISLGQMLVPFTSSYRPLAVGLGVTAAELMAAVGLTNLFRKQLPHTVWRKAHYLTLAVWALASLHGVLAGTDRGVPWFAGVVAAAFTAVCLAGLVRVRAASALTA